MATFPAFLENLECSICSDFVDDPRLLPCGHLFCGPHKKCITSLKSSDGSVVCPNCRAHHDIDVRELKPIYALRSFLESCAKSTQKENIVDETKVNKEMADCEFHLGQELTYFCEDCEGRSCKVCWRTKHATHRVVLLEMKFINEVSNALTKVDIGSQLSIYDSLIENNKKRQRYVLAILAEIDMLNAIFSTQKASLQELDSKCKTFLNDGPVDEKTKHELMTDLAAIPNNDQKKTEQSVKIESRKLFDSFLETFFDCSISNSGEKSTQTEIPSEATKVDLSCQQLKSVGKPEKNEERLESNFEQKLEQGVNMISIQSSSQVPSIPKTSSVSNASFSETKVSCDDSQHGQWRAAASNLSTPSYPSSATSNVVNTSINRREIVNYRSDRVVSRDGIISYMKGNILNTKWSIVFTVRDFSFSGSFSTRIATKFPQIPKICHGHKPIKGGFGVFVDDDVNPRRFVYTLVTDVERYPPNSKDTPLKAGLRGVLNHAIAANLKVLCMPRLSGTDGDGLKFAEVASLIKDVCKGKSIEICVYNVYD